MPKPRMIAIAVVIALVALYVADAAVDNRMAAQKVVDESVTIFRSDVSEAIYNNSSSAEPLTPEEAASAHAKLSDSTDEVIAAARKNPDAVYSADGEYRTMRQVLSDAAVTLSPYEPEISKKLDAAVEVL